MCNIQPVIDLWTMRPFAYALVDNAGNPYKSQSPHELYQFIDIAYFRDFNPLIVQPLEGMTESSSEPWNDFIRDFPNMTIYRYNDGVVQGMSNETLMSDKGLASLQWVRGVSDPKTIDDLQKKNVRFASGVILARPDPIVLPELKRGRMGKREFVTVQWA